MTCSPDIVTNSSRNLTSITSVSSIIESLFMIHSYSIFLILSFPKLLFSMSSILILTFLLLIYSLTIFISRISSILSTGTINLYYNHSLLSPILLITFMFTLNSSFLKISCIFDHCLYYYYL